MIIKDALLNALMVLLYTNQACSLDHPKNLSLIYILIWTHSIWPPFHHLQPEGVKVFKHCDFKNCFVTDNHDYFNNILDYDVILFNVMQLHHHGEEMELPSRRYEEQKYGFVSVEPANMYPITERFNNFFNFTWTYRFNSEVTVPYVVVKDQFDKVIGPKAEMHWMNVKQMNSTSDYVKGKLQDKTKAAAWFVSNCDSTERFIFAENMQLELAKYGHRIDIYGGCTEQTCSQTDVEGLCYSWIERDYYFYLAFENSHNYDYVSEKLLTALEHFAIPVVYGGANYTRFMPNGIYLNAYNLGVKDTVKKMVDLINNKEKYYDYFKWHGYYSFHSTDEDKYAREVCALCAFLNNKTFKTPQHVSNMTSWWSSEDEELSRYRIIVDVQEKELLPGVVGFFNSLYNYIFD